MKKLVSIILLMSILFTTVYADYDFETFVIDEVDNYDTRLYIEKVSDNVISYEMVTNRGNTAPPSTRKYRASFTGMGSWSVSENYYWDSTPTPLPTTEVSVEFDEKVIQILNQESLDLRWVSANRRGLYSIEKSKMYIFDEVGNIIAEIPYTEDDVSYYHNFDALDDGIYYTCLYRTNSSKTKNNTIYDHTGRVLLDEESEFLKTGIGRSLYRLDCGTYVGNNGYCLWALKSDTINLAYNTDILTYINGVEIPCYAVDGYPCVFAEDLGGYLFDVAWNGEEKRLDLTRNPEYVEINPVEVPAKGEHNTIFTDIYKNDVTVTVNGNAVKSYNTNGKMLIRAKDLENSGVTVTYENKKTIFDVLKENIEVYVNDTAVTFDQQPIIVEGRTLVPVRAIFEALGATVEWDEGSETVTSVKDGITVALKIGDNIMYVNGEGKELDVPAQLVNDRTLVPVRAISEAFGCTVDWNDITYSVCIK